MTSPGPTEEAVVPVAGLPDEIARRIRDALPATGTLVVFIEVLGNDPALDRVRSAVEGSLAAEPRIVFSRLASGASVPETTTDGSYSEAIMVSEEPTPAPQLRVQLTGSGGTLQAAALQTLGPGVIWTPFRLTTSGPID